MPGRNSNVASATSRLAWVFGCLPACNASGRRRPRRCRRWQAVAAGATWLVGSPLAAPAEITVRDPGKYVVDSAGIVDDDAERKLEGWLRELEQKTTAQVKVLTVPSTDGEPFFDFVQRHAELWKLGRKGEDNGVLIVVAVHEREVRIHTGYGLESALPDSWCGSLTRNVMVPPFRQGAFSAGIYQGTVAVANKVADAANVGLTGIPEYRYASERTQGAPPQGVACGAGIVPFILLIIILSSMSRRRRYYRRWGGGLGEAIFWGSVMSDLMRGGRSRGGSGGLNRGSFGGFGGPFGGFGGFSGGRSGGFGGSFGGGGRFGGGGGGAKW